MIQLESISTTTTPFPRMEESESFPENLRSTSHTEGLLGPMVVHSETDINGSAHIMATKTILKGSREMDEDVMLVLNKLKTCTHDNLLPLSSSKVCHDFVSMSYKWLEIPNLNEYVQRWPEPISRTFVLNVMLQCGQALFKLHDNNLYHGDIHLNNIFWNEQRNRIVLTDSSTIPIYRICNGKALADVIENRKTFSPAYYFQPPEVFLSTSLTTSLEKLDTFSMGCVLGTLCSTDVRSHRCGILPGFESKGLGDLMATHLAEGKVPPHFPIDDTPENTKSSHWLLHRLASRMTSPCPGQRPSLKVTQHRLKQLQKFTLLLESNDGIIEFCTSLGTGWYPFGLFLGIESCVLDRYRQSPNSALDMILAWKSASAESFCDKMHTIVEALKHVNRLDILHELLCIPQYHIPETDLRKIAEILHPQWKPFGIKLGLKEQQLEAIETDNPNDCVQQTFESLRLVQRTYGCTTDATLNFLTLLKECDDITIRQIADRILKRNQTLLLQKPSPPTHEVQSCPKTIFITETHMVSMETVNTALWTLLQKHELSRYVTSLTLNEEKGVYEVLMSAKKDYLLSLVRQESPDIIGHIALIEESGNECVVSQCYGPLRCGDYVTLTGENGFCRIGAFAVDALGEMYIVTTGHGFGMDEGKNVIHNTQLEVTLNVAGSQHTGCITTDGYGYIGPYMFSPTSIPTYVDIAVFRLPFSTPDRCGRPVSPYFQMLNQIQNVSELSKTVQKFRQSTAQLGETLDFKAMLRLDNVLCGHNIILKDADAATFAIPGDSGSLIVPSVPTGVSVACTEEHTNVAIGLLHKTFSFNNENRYVVMNMSYGLQSINEIHHLDLQLLSMDDHLTAMSSVAKCLESSRIWDDTIRRQKNSLKPTQLLKSRSCPVVLRCPQNITDDGALKQMTNQSSSDDLLNTDNSLSDSDDSSDDSFDSIELPVSKADSVSMLAGSRESLSDLFGLSITSHNDAIFSAMPYSASPSDWSNDEVDSDEELWLELSKQKSIHGSNLSLLTDPLDPVERKVRAMSFTHVEGEPPEKKAKLYRTSSTSHLGKDHSASAVFHKPNVSSPKLRRSRGYNSRSRSNSTRSRSNSSMFMLF